MVAVVAVTGVPDDDDMAIAPFPLVLVKECPLPEVEADADEPEGTPAVAAMYTRHSEDCTCT